MKKKIILMGVIVLAIMLITTGCGVGEEQGSPEDVVEAYFNAFQDKDFQKAMNLTVGGETLSEQDIENLGLLFDQVQIKDYEIGEADMVDNDEAYVTVTITTIFNGDESIAVDDVRVIKIDGRWFIYDGLVDDDDDWDNRETSRELELDFDDMELDIEDLFDSEEVSENDVNEQEESFED